MFGGVGPVMNFSYLKLCVVCHSPVWLQLVTSSGLTGSLSTEIKTKTSNCQSSLRPAVLYFRCGPLLPEEKFCPVYVYQRERESVYVFVSVCVESS